jgi:hypothetical protein
MSNQSNTRRAFQWWLRQIDVGRDLIQSGRGNEENIKIKVVVPFLRQLGWHMAHDMQFEEHGIDILLRDGRGGPLTLLVECKSWDTQLSANEVRNQCLEYAYTFRFPHILVASGQSFQILSAWLQPGDLAGAEPIHEFSWDTLLSGSKEDWARIEGLLSRRALTGSSHAIADAVRQRLAKSGTPKSVDQFSELAACFRKKQVANRITLEEFSEHAKGHPIAIRQTLEQCLELFHRLALESSSRLVLRRRSKEIGLTVIDTTGPRIRRPCLVGLYAERALVTLDTEEWRRLGLSVSAQQALKGFPKHLKDWESAAAFRVLLENSLKEVGLAA